jgi:haloalkane dehalogenase
VTSTRAAPLDLAPIRSIYPFEQRRFAVPGGAINYVDEGHGPAVLMLHGNPTWSFYYRRLILALRASHRVIVPDHLGCGLSDKPQQYPYRLENHIENLVQLVRHLGIDRCDLVVHDWGGAIGLGAAVRRAFELRRLVLFNTAAFLSPRIPWRIGVCKIPGLGALAIRGLNGFARGATLMAVERPLDPQVRAGYLLPYRGYHDRIANLRFVQDIPLRPSHPTWATVDAIDQGLARFRNTPTLILWGGRDWCFNDYFLADWRQRLPDARVVRYDDAGHYVLEDAHAAIVPELARFLG